MRHLHTLNGTAVTSSRTLIAVLETHQRSDGGVDIPEVLHGFGAAPGPELHPAPVRPSAGKPASLWSRRRGRGRRA